MTRTLNTITYSGEALLRMVEQADPSGEPLKALRAQADDLLHCERLSVVDRKLRAASGDPHDYMSMGPYWWPNPDTPDGLPYVRRDGEVNPETVEPITYGRLTWSVHTLALAALYFKEPGYANKAVQLLRDWHLEPETAMNPHLEYGQSIPGICAGRGIGLIDFAPSYRLFDGVAILAYLDALDSETLSGLKAWYVAFVNWMLTSETGADEDRQHNNHGAWFDVQVAAAALFTDRPFLAKKTLTAAYERRVALHIREDGSQPHELARTRGLTYSLYNLEALVLLGNLATKLGVKRPYWQPDGEVGDRLRLAVDYLYPYVKDPSTFPYQELSPDGAASRMLPLLACAAHSYPGQGYEEKLETLASEGDLLWRLVPPV
jgi:hypothetical protein